MTLRPSSFAALLLAAALPCAADSGSSASSASSASVGSLSGSIQGSSNSSSGKKEVAAGEYRILEVAEVPGQPGLARLTLQGADSEFRLLMPAPTLAQQGLVAGDRVAVRPRPYGLEFARVDTREPFFLVLADDWLRELDPKPVAL